MREIPIVCLEVLSLESPRIQSDATAAPTDIVETAQRYSPSLVTMGNPGQSSKDTSRVTAGTQPTDPATSASNAHDHDDLPPPYRQTPPSPSLSASSHGEPASGYQQHPLMSASATDARDDEYRRWNDMKGRRGFVCSSNGGWFCSNRGGVCCSDRGGWFCSDREGVWCADTRGICCAGKGAVCCS